MQVDTYEVALAREVLYGALNRCPLESCDCELGDCELCELRRMSLNARHRWLLDLDDTECLELARKHRECIHHQLHAN